MNPWVKAWLGSERSKSLSEFKEEWLLKASSEEPEEEEQSTPEKITLPDPIEKKKYDPITLQIPKPFIVRDKTISSKMPSELYKDLEHYAYSHGVTVSEAVYRMVLTFIERDKA